MIGADCWVKRASVWGRAPHGRRLWGAGARVAPLKIPGGPGGDAGL